jgi:hypothetical protein
VLSTFYVSIFFFSLVSLVALFGLSVSGSRHVALVTVQTKLATRARLYWLVTGRFRALMLAKQRSFGSFTLVKNMQLSYVFVAFFAVPNIVDGEVKTSNSSETVIEAEILWDRLLQQDDLSMPLVNPGKTPTPVAPPVAVPLSCIVDVTIECVTSHGLACDDIQPPNPVCAVGAEVTSVTFGYSGKSCNPSGNSQGTEAFCQDFLQIDVSETVTVLCQDAEVAMTGLVVEPPMIPIGGILTITAPSGSLPDKIDCIISDGAESQIQYLKIDLSGEAPLQLTDEFGAFTLLACANSGASTGVQSCIDTLIYSIEIGNSGAVEMNLTTATLDIDDNTTPLLTEDNVVLFPGQSTSFERRQLIDLCIGAEYCAETVIEAKSLSGTVCGNSDQFCIQLPPLPKVPAAPSVVIATIAPATTPVKVPAIPPFATPVSPPATTIIPVTAPVKVPVIPTSAAPISPPVNAPVIPPFSTPTTTPIKRPATSPVLVPKTSPVQFPILLPVTAPMITLIPVPIAPPSPLPSAATCVLQLDTTCTITGNSRRAGQPCDTPSQCAEPCTDRPQQITLLYQGGDCSQSDNAQALKSTCADSNGGPPTTEGSRSFIVVTDIPGNGTTYFQGVVPVGSQYVLGDGVSRVGSDMFINIFTEDRSTLLQAVQYHTSCSNLPLQLKDRFGASQLVQFTNAAQGSVSCSVDFSFRVDISVPTSVSGSVSLTFLNATTNFGGDVDLTDQASGEVISSGGGVAVVLVGTVDASVRFKYAIMFVVAGTQNPGGDTCQGMDAMSFGAGNRPGAPTFPTPSAPIGPAGRRTFT